MLPPKDRTGRAVATTEERYRGAARGATVGILTNLVLAAVKVLLGLAGNSVAVIADGLHSLSDTLSSGVVLIGIRKARKPPDQRHPFGHYRAETVAARFVAAFLVVVAAGVFWQAVQRITSAREFGVPGAVALWACILSIVVKEGLFQYKIRVAERTLSEAVRVDAWHHRSDALSSIAALIGVVAARMGGPDWAVADPIAGLAIGLVIGYFGVRSLVRTTGELMDAVPYVGIGEDIHGIARQVPGVCHTDDANVRKAGMQFFATLHVEVDPNLTVKEGHEIAGRVRDRIMQSFPQMASVVVHVEPCFDAEHLAGEQAES